MDKKVILIVAGEPNSVFFEILFKSLKKIKRRRAIILIGCKRNLINQAKFLNYKINLNIIDKNDIKNLKKNINTINLIDVEYKNKKIFQKISSDSNEYISNCFKVSFEILKKNKSFNLINGPISKKYFLRNKYPGITEFLAKKFNKKNKISMLIFHKDLSVCPITTHLPIAKISKNLSKKSIITQISLINKFFKSVIKKKAKIGVTGLNPHCENFLNFNEERMIIEPSIKFLKKRKFFIKGPMSADTIFTKENIKKFNVVVGMYHDQVLTPSKTLFGFEPINITLGLPFIRVSPDHGPNESMMGKNISDPTSLIQSLNFLNKYC